MPGSDLVVELSRWRALGAAVGELLSVARAVDVDAMSARLSG